MIPRIVLATILMINSWLFVFGQVLIWQETFENYSDGTTVGSNWTSGGCVSCIDTADWWEIRSGVMEARDVNEVVFLQTEAIDISGFSNVQFSIEINELGDHEGLYFGLDACADQDKEDYVNVLYRLDGGPWNLVSNALNWCGLYASCGNHTLYGDDGINSGDCRDHDDDWGTATVDAAGLNGDWLEIRIEIINSATDEIIRLDNLTVQGEILLPITLAEFALEVEGNKVMLRWKTISETNNDYFEIERTSLMANMNWTSIAVIQGAGNSAEVRQYHYQDAKPLNGRSLYRLKQVDFDGKYQYSSIIQAVINTEPHAYPNPARDFVYIPIPNMVSIAPLISMYYQTGMEYCVSYNIVDDRIMLNTSNLKAGYYTFTLNNRNHRVLILR